MFLSLSFSFPSPLSKNKYRKSWKKLPLKICCYWQVLEFKFFSGVEGKTSLQPKGSQLPVAQKNSHTTEAHPEVARSEPCRIKWWKKCRKACRHSATIKSFCILLLSGIVASVGGLLRLPPFRSFIFTCNLFDVDRESRYSGRNPVMGTGKDIKSHGNNSFKKVLIGFFPHKTPHSTLFPHSASHSQLHLPI